MTLDSPGAEPAADPSPCGRGLAGWQVRQASALMLGEACNNLRLTEVAAACGLSRSHFSKAFKESTGLSPHQWRIQRRIDRCKAYLIDGSLSLAQIAAECGFADQSHLTRVFSKAVGTAPGAWRRRAVSDGDETAPMVESTDRAPDRPPDKSQDKSSIPRASGLAP